MTQNIDNDLSRGLWVSASADGHKVLDQTTLDLWRIPLDQTAQMNVLSEDELARFNRYRFAADQRKFAVARSSLRHILASYVQTTPAGLVFDYGPHGKPALHQDKSLHFNLSHSGEYALCGVAKQVLGVDIELLRPMDRLDGLVQRCLAPSEQRALLQTPTSEQSTGFLKYWTCKEAYLKATGQGISESLTAIEVDLTLSPKLKVPSRPWQLWVFAPCSGYTAALVTAPGITQIRCWAYAAKDRC